MYDSDVSEPIHLLNSRAVAAVLLATMAIAIPALDAADQAAPWLGVWRLDMEKSDFASGPTGFKRATSVIEPFGDRVRVSYDLVGVRGGVIHTEWTGRFDGRDYAVQGTDVVMTNAYTRVDDRSYAIVTKVEGRIEANATVTISPDGQTMTTVTTIRHPEKGNVRSTTVYRKQTAGRN
jgi:hypothetical protein